MNLHEYQSKQLFARYGIPIPEGRMASSPEEAVAAAEAITSPAADSRGPAVYRTKMAGVMLARALARAKERTHA